MKSVIQLIKFLFSGLGAGIDTIKKVAPQVALPYLFALQRFILIAVAVPIALVAVGFILYWISLLGKDSWTFWKEWIVPMWRIPVLLGGINALGFGVLLAVFAAPIGALISAATVPPQSATATRTAATLPWYRWFSPIGILREFREIGAELMKSLRAAIEQYIGAVRTVLVVVGFGFFFFASLPRPSVTLLLLCTIGVAAIWLNRAYRTVWSWLAQVGAIGVMLWFVLRLIFPKIEPDKLVLGGTSAKDLTNENLTSLRDGWVTWIVNHWTGVAIGLAVVLLITYLLVKMFRKTLAGTTGGGGHQTATASAHGSGGGSLLGKAIMIACLALCVGMAAIMVMKVMELNERRNASIDESMESRRTHEVARKAMQTTSSLVAQVNGRAAATQPAAMVPQTQMSMPVPEVWCGLQNPTKYEFQLTTNWSKRIERPEGMSVMFAPSGLPSEVRKNGMEILRRKPGWTAPLPSDTRFFEIRLTNDNTAPISVVVGVGKKIKS